jgi:hypothetical protein
MVEKPTSGELFGVPYNFERPKISNMLSAYWQPGKSLLVEKPFGIGYTLNLANWRSWVVIAAAAAMVWHERQSDRTAEETEMPESVEVLVDD